VEDLERYLNEIVEPTLNDFRTKPSSVRIGFPTIVDCSRKDFPCRSPDPI
jgi:hypothetical protein